MESEISFERLKQALAKSSDVILKEVYAGKHMKVPVGVAVVDGVANHAVFSQFVLQPLLSGKEFIECDEDQLKDLIEKGRLWYEDFEKTEDFDTLLVKLLSYGTALILGKTAYVFQIRGYEKRSISEPSGENILKGAKDAFTEIIRVNTATIRQKIDSPDLCFEMLQIGKQTKTPVVIAYMKNICNDAFVNEVRARLNEIDTADVLTVAFIQEYLSDDKYTAFPQSSWTERPDIFCSNLIEGHVGILVHGLPISVILPVTLPTLLHSSEDYAHNYLLNSFTRILRHIMLFFVLYVPAGYVAMTTFHQELIPTSLAASIAASKEGVPLPIFIEVIALLLAFEVLVEAGLRLPKVIGQAVSIVGALVVGSAAVSAKLISPGVVIIVSIAVISGFAMPNQDVSDALRIWRLVMAILAGILGLFGIIMGTILLFTDLCSIEVLGVPYLAPYAGRGPLNLKDTLIRTRVPGHKFRSAFLSPKNKRKAK